MAGIYIHIPFCRKQCHYCNFHFSTSLRYKNELVAALLKEILLQKNYLEQEPIDTIYIGGGTPSLLEPGELADLLRAIHLNYNVNPGTEITIETNPDDINDEILIKWKSAGVNRLSIGVQSFFDEDLQWMNRAHNSDQAKRCLSEAISVFDNITIDLIYGYPLLTNQKWKSNVETAINFQIPHLSCYALTVEPKTPLDKLIRQHKLENIDAEKQSEQFLLLMHWMREHGYDHYEISNFAKPGWKSRHNSSYWQGKKYLGIGPSAHSYNLFSRQWNVSNNQVYIDSINKGIIPAEKELLTETQKLNEYIMTSIRTQEGTSINRAGNDVLVKSEKYLVSGLMRMENGSLILTNEGKLLADGIAAELFY